MDLTIVSPCYYPDLSCCEKLVETASKADIPIHFYGLGQEWPWLFEAKVLQLHQELKYKVSSEYVMICDGDDAFLLGNKEEIGNRYLESRAKILVSADRQQAEGDSKYPQSIFRDNYPTSETPWRYCNSGGYIGKRLDIMNLLRTMAMTNNSDLFPIWRSRDWANDQFRMSVVYLQGHSDITIDTECKLFQTMGCIEKDEVLWKERRIINTVTLQQPLVIHFNGNAPGIDEAYAKSK